MSPRVWTLVALVVLATAIAPGSAQAETIIPMFFDGFDAEEEDVLNSSLFNWNVTSGKIDVLAKGNLCGPAGNYSQCLDLDGTGSKAGTIESMYTFDLQPGNTYRLTFDLAGAHRPWKGSESNTVYISLGYYFSTFHTMGRWDPFQTFVHDFTVDDPGLANLKFDHMGNDHVGLLLDNVSLSMVVPDGPIIVDPPEQPEVVPVPEPGTWSLFAAGLGILAWRRRNTRG